ncbi:MAG TPA: RidA family protein [Alphaproteobacteria bacterium]|jgi:enamine deaminase RidA (YjgF/YER057c/UK114 family)
MPGKIEQRMAERGIVLPPPMRAMANYVPYTVTRAHVWVAGQGPFRDGKLHYNGRLGETLTVEDGRACARIVGLNVLAQVKAACGGDLDRVVRCVKLGGFVNSTPDFTQHPEVINGASELMIEVFGEAGRHARFAVGAPTLPMGTSVEIDALFEIRP